MNDKAEFPRYPVGTVLWKMESGFNDYCGSPADEKIHWRPEAHAIQHTNENVFMFSHGGASWGAIGKTYFLTREECIEDWGNRPMIEDPPPKGDPPPLPDLNKLEIWREDSVSILTITVCCGFNREFVSTEKLDWHVDPNVDEWGHRFGFTVEHLTLQEISDQIKTLYPLCSIIEVRREEPLKGVIYQYGNYGDDEWREHGTLNGYA